MGGQDEAQKDEDQTKEQTYNDDADDDAEIEDQGNNNNNINDEGEEGQKQGSSPWTVSPCTHCLLSKWTCVPYWNGPWTFQVLFFYVDFNERFFVEPRNSTQKQ